MFVCEMCIDRIKDGLSDQNFASFLQPLVIGTRFHEKVLNITDKI